MPIIKANACNCCTCIHMQIIHEPDLTINEIKLKHEGMHAYSAVTAYKCNGPLMIQDEDIIRLAILFSFSGRNISCRSHLRK